MSINNQEKDLHIETFKRSFSNDKDKDALKNIIQSENLNNYSFYTMKYKYAFEYSLDFMVSNFILGTIQRLEKSRKVSFGCFVYKKEDDNYVIECAWIFCEKEIPFIFKEEFDMDYYNIKEIDITNEKELNEINNIFSISQNEYNEKVYYK